MQLTDTSTIAEARQFIDEGKAKGVICPCCDRIAKEYNYTLNSGQAVALITIYRLTKRLNPAGGWLHILRAFGEHTTLNPQSLSFHRLKLWGLIEQQPVNDDPKKKTSGFWAITDRGISFVEHRIRVPEQVSVYEGTITHMGGNSINIKEALRNKFDYQELMAEFYLPEPKQGSLL